MQNMYQGGACGPNGLATSNQFKRAMAGLAMGSDNPERLMQMGQKGQGFEEEIMAREAAFKAMGQGWNQASSQHQQAMALQNAKMEGVMNNAMAEQHRIMMMQQMGWERAQEQARIEEMRLAEQFEKASIEEQARHWQNEMKMEEKFEDAKVSYQNEQKSILDSSSSMLQVMMNDPDPRFQNSQFLNFLGRIQKGQVKIEGKELKEVKPDLEGMEKAWGDAEQIYQSNLASMDPSFQEAKAKEAEATAKAQTAMEQNWQEKLKTYEEEYANQADFEKMLEERYMNVLQEMNFDLTEAWQASTDLEEQLVHGPTKQEYVFDPNNPYKEVPFPKQLALELINQGNNNQAVLALEAHLQKQPTDAETWRILGRILQENDQDQKSIPCFNNCLKNDPNNLDCLLSLGVSCTNVLDEVKAMNYLKRWIMLNPKYNMQQVANIIPENMVDLPSYKVEDIRNINEQLIGAFSEAAKMNSNDPELLSALAILFFIKRDYQASIELFNQSLNLDPTNYLLMNKVGATLAHLGRAEEAIKFYHRALDLRPNYVRVWVNIGIAHAFLNLYDQAANFYLNALSFRPDAKHIWSYLHTSFLSLQRYDLLGQIASQNPHSFTDFDVIKLDDLPQPQISYAITTQKHILNRDAQSWLQEFQPK